MLDLNCDGRLDLSYWHISLNLQTAPEGHNVENLLEGCYAVVVIFRVFLSPKKLGFHPSKTQRSTFVLKLQVVAAEVFYQLCLLQHRLCNNN